MFSDEEKIRTAQLLLGFLYRLDPVHIERMIDLDNFNQFLDKYKQKIKNYKTCEEQISKLYKDIDGAKKSNKFSDDKKLQTIQKLTLRLNNKKIEKENLLKYIETNEEKQREFQQARQVGQMMEEWLQSIK